MSKKIYILVGTVMVVLVVAIVVLLQMYNEKSKAYDEVVDIMVIEKDSIQREYEDYLVLFDGYQQRGISNDSLQDLLSREQQRVQDLLEELRQTKASNARKITELKNELATVRAVAQDLVRQINELNETNARLEAENQQVKQENKEVKEQNTHLTNLNNQLSETVSRASMLEISSLDLVMLNKNDRKTRMVSHMQKLEFDFEIAKNITCKPGMKDLYARIMDPEGNLLGETEEHLFHFENLDIAYTMSLPFEYTGEEYKGVCYYAFAPEEEVKKGYYTIDFFCDGNLIGSFPFQLKK